MSYGNSEREKVFEKIKRKLIPIITALVLAIIASYLGLEDLAEQPDSSNPTPPPTNTAEQIVAEGELMVTMIDVGQADSFLLEQGDMVMLVDCGTRSSGDDVVKYLNEQGITKIDYLFGTHPHDDHMGGMYDVITAFEVGKVIIPKISAEQQTAAWYMKLMNELKNGGQDKEKHNYGGYEVEYAKLGTMYQLGDAKVKIIGPVEDYYNNLNNYSTVLMVSFGDMDIIMTGDAETLVEEQILDTGENLDAEILKVGHHGSDTSTSDEFLSAVSPEYALISAEVGNKYDHPIESIMDKLVNDHVEVYRTDECGTVVITITQSSVSFSTEPGDYLSGIEVKERYSK